MHLSSNSINSTFRESVDKLKARLILFYGVLSVTSSSFIIRAAYDSLGFEAPYTLAFVRVLSTALVSLFVLSSVWQTSSSPRGINRRDLLFMAVAGIALATHFGWWFSSLRFIPVGVSLSLTNTAPVWLTFLLFLFYQKLPSNRQYLAIASVLVGSTILFLGNADFGEQGALGLILALASAIGFALYLLMAKGRVDEFGLWKYFGMVNLFAALTLLFWIVSLDELSLLMNWELWGWGLLLAIVPGVMGHAVYNWSMNRLDSIDVGIATLGEPVLGTILAIFIEQELLGWYQSIAIFFLILAIALTLDFRSRPEPEEKLYPLEN